MPNRYYDVNYLFCHMIDEIKSIPEVIFNFMKEILSEYRMFPRFVQGMLMPASTINIEYITPSEIIMNHLIVFKIQKKFLGLMRYMINV